MWYTDTRITGGRKYAREKETEMASNKSKREIRFVLTDEDYSAFGRYRIMYTAGGRKLVNRQRLTYLICGVCIAALFTVFHVDRNFTLLAYGIAAVIGIGGTIFAEKLVLKQQSDAIKKSQDSIERVHPDENIITLGDDVLITDAGEDHQEFDYKEIKLVDLTEDAIYVWMSDTMIMPIPRHAFRNMDDMKASYKFIREKIKEKGGKIDEE